MGKHAKQNDEDKHPGTGDKPGPIPAEGAGGKHEKPDDQDGKDHKDDKDKGT